MKKKSSKNAGMKGFLKIRSLHDCISDNDDNMNQCMLHFHT